MVHLLYQKKAGITTNFRLYFSCFFGCILVSPYAYDLNRIWLSAVRNRSIQSFFRENRYYPTATGRKGSKITVFSRVFCLGKVINLFVY